MSAPRFWADAFDALRLDGACFPPAAALERAPVAVVFAPAAGFAFAPETAFAFAPAAGFAFAPEAAFAFAPETAFAPAAGFAFFPAAAFTPGFELVPAASASARFSGFADLLLSLADGTHALSIPVLGAARFPEAFGIRGDVPFPFAGFFCAALSLIAFSDIYMIAPLICVIAIMPIKRAYKPF